MCEASARISSARIVLRYWLATLIPSTLLGLLTLPFPLAPPLPLGSIALDLLDQPARAGCPPGPRKGQFPHEDGRVYDISGSGRENQHPLLEYRPRRGPSS